MASFTDAITQFNPYVAQLPVEAMKEVGMYKQAKYEEGVQKIQGEIDKISGLDVVRDIDKQYEINNNADLDNGVFHKLEENEENNNDLIINDNLNPQINNKPYQSKNYAE